MTQWHGGKGDTPRTGTYSKQYKDKNEGLRPSIFQKVGKGRSIRKNPH